jgi:hypothetical protein
MDFNFDVGGSSDPSKLAKSDYAFVCEDAEVKTTRAGNGQYVNCKFVVADGPCKGKIVWTMFNISNPSETAQKIGREQLSKLCMAIGFKEGDKLTDTAMLLRKPFKGSLDIKQRKDNGENYFDIVKFDKLDDQTAARILKEQADRMPSDSSEPPF